MHWSQKLLICGTAVWNTHSRVLRLLIFVHPIAFCVHLVDVKSSIHNQTPACSDFSSYKYNCIPQVATALYILQKQGLIFYRRRICM
jgi:hypothetical protein